MDKRVISNAMRITVVIVGVIMAANYTAFAEIVENPAIYTLTTCPVDGKPLDAPVILQHGEREIRFCSESCKTAFQAEPGKYIEAIDKQLIEQQKPYYPLDTCVVSGDKLGGGMGEPVDYVYKNRLVRFCCKGCIDPFLKDPGKFLGQIDKAIVEKQAPAYPLKQCPVMKGEIKEGQGVDYIFGNRLVRFCCKACVKTFEADPAKYLKMLDAGKIEENAPETMPQHDEHQHMH